MARRDEGATGARPSALTRIGAGGPVLAAVDAAAEQAGLWPGMTLPDARALAPALRAAEADPRGETRILETLADRLDRYAPLVAIDPDRAGGGAGFFLDITGCAHLFGGEAEMLADMRDRMADWGFPARAAIAPTPGAAWALARWTEAAAEGRIVADADLADALDPLPVAALRLNAAALTMLDRLGLRRIGDLRAAPRAGLAARFGPAPGRRIDQAFGDAAEPAAQALRDQGRAADAPEGDRMVDAIDVARLGAALSPDDHPAVPRYLRPPSVSPAAWDKAAALAR